MESEMCTFSALFLRSSAENFVLFRVHEYYKLRYQIKRKHNNFGEYFSAFCVREPVFIHAFS